MSGYWNVLRREVDERRLLLVGALLLGVLPFAAALLPVGLGRDLSRSRLEVAAILALIAAGVTALALGASVIARDLAERRLGFYFQRPLSGWAIWGGKLSAATGLALATGALIALPAVLVDFSSIRQQPANGWLALGGIAALLAVLALSHAGSIILRARSPWLLLDFAGALATTGLLLAATNHLLRAGAFSYRMGLFDILERGQLGLAIGAFAAALSAGGAQVLSARTDLRRGHRALSLTLWAGMLAAALLFTGFAHWVTSVGPTDLRAVKWVQSSPAGPWLALGGPVPHRPGYEPTFLLDTETGRSIALHAVLINDFGPKLQFSADGRRAAWLERSDLRYVSPQTLILLDLAAREPKPMTTSLVFGERVETIALSPNGDRLAVIDNDRLLVYQLAGGKIVASVSIPKAYAWERHLRFLDEARVRLYQMIDEKPLQLGTTGEIFDLELASPTPTLVLRSRFTASSTRPFFEASPNGRYLYTRMDDRPVVLDVETGREALDLSTPEAGIRHRYFVFLADGRSVQVLITSKSRTLRLFGPDFQEQRRIRVEGDHPLIVGGLLASNSLAVTQSRRRSSGSSQESDTLQVDLATGAIRPLAHGLTPIWDSSVAKSGSLAPRLFLRGRGLVRIDPDNGRETVIVPGGPTTPETEEK